MAAPVRTQLDISRLLTEAGTVLSNRLAAALAEVDLTPRAQCVLIHALEEERTQIQLAALAGLDKTTMVGTVDDLERRGLAERRPSATDRRARIIAVTEPGRAAAEEGQRIVDRVHEEVLADVEPARREVFLDLLIGLASAEPVPGPKAIRRPRGR
ncbi:MULTISPECIES: MarR family transcriptional regulator [Actinoplanes]|uniref:MarR family winged helix-turn-helix transcriptional regulator n=1 Tax=Actinoplanes TaxID=1865 RepID=UPI0005F27950|nr:MULTISPECIES: MarR family transcriptional regulator [Actinoplanes]GLY01840.1 hypothetical protein Acsp01_22190 [Actinoplanes sp. NBRC 101535]